MNRISPEQNFISQICPLFPCSRTSFAHLGCSATWLTSFTVTACAEINIQTTRNLDGRVEPTNKTTRFDLRVDHNGRRRCVQGPDGSVPETGAEPGEAEIPVGVADGGAERGGGGGRRHSFAGRRVGLCSGLFLRPESVPECIGFNGPLCLRVHALVWGDHLLVYIEYPFEKSRCLIDS